ncbi:MAG: ATP-binding protein [Pseudomonadota bacterium]
MSVFSSLEWLRAAFAVGGVRSDRRQISREAHGGSLSIESCLGLGTAVTVVLPPSRCVPKADAPVAAHEIPYLRLVARE